MGLCRCHLLPSANWLGQPDEKKVEFTKNGSFFFEDQRLDKFSGGMPPKRGGNGGSGAQKRAPAPLPDAVGAKKKSSTPARLTWALRVRTEHVGMGKFEGS